MRLGMYLDLRMPPTRAEQSWSGHYARWLERVEEAERRGAEAVWLTEHHFFDDGYLPQCWTLAAAVAARTSSVRIGTATVLLPLHSSLELAEQIAIVDILSNGRVEPGFGVGYRKPEYLAFGGDYKRRYSVFASRIEQLRQHWGEVPGAEPVVTPGPVQRPLPLWAGFGGPMGARIAGRLGLGLQSLVPETVREYEVAFAGAGHDPSSARVCGPCEFFVTDDPERTWVQIGEHVLRRWSSYNHHMFAGTSREHDPPTHFDSEQIRSRFMLGTAEEIAEKIRDRTSGLPVTDVYVWADYPGLSDDLIDHHLESAFTEVAPLLRQEP